MTRNNPFPRIFASRNERRLLFILFAYWNEEIRIISIVNKIFFFKITQTSNQISLEFDSKINSYPQITHLTVSHCLRAESTTWSIIYHAWPMLHPVPSTRSQFLSSRGIDYVWLTGAINRNDGWEAFACSKHCIESRKQCTRF